MGRLVIRPARGLLGFCIVGLWQPQRAWNFLNIILVDASRRYLKKVVNSQFENVLES